MDKHEIDKDNMINVNFNNSKPRKIILYIVYGKDQTYYDGAIYSYLTFKNWVSKIENIEFIVLTEMPEKFVKYPLKTLLISQNQIRDWSLNGKYHFRIKNRGMAYVMDQLNLNDLDKILFFDTDTYFHKNPLPLFDLIQTNQALFYLNEGMIYKRKRFNVYVENLDGKKITIDDNIYKLSKSSSLWGSLMVGLSGNMRSNLEWADKLMVKFFDIVPSHTIEPFALSESLIKKYKIVEGKDYVSLYSTSRKKIYAKKLLTDFMNKNSSLPIDEQVSLAQKVRIKRPFYIIIFQRLQRLFNQ